jgi:hypothetical protein
MCKNLEPAADFDEFYDVVGTEVPEPDLFQYGYDRIYPPNATNEIRKIVERIKARTKA